MRHSTLLLEIGCEEIPAATLPGALSDLSARIVEALGGASGLGGASPSPPPFGSPRRLVAFVEEIRHREADRVDLVTGPPVPAAFGKDGRPTRAAEGFARAQGVTVEDLERVRSDKGEVVAAQRKVTGRTAMEVLRTAIPQALGSMRFPKMMKWGNAGHAFVRPVHWIVALLDAEVVDFEFLGVRSGRRTRGHRFLAADEHEIADAREYETILAERGRVIVRNAHRAGRIREGMRRAAGAKDWKVREDESLLEELTFLGEHPEVIIGSFPVDFLDLPDPVLVTSMRHHQKYFTMRDGGGRLAPGFLAVIDRDGDPDGTIVRGNEWVLRARLSDAGFFWREDRRRSLDQRVDALARITFQEKLGSVAQRTVRLVATAGWLANAADLEAPARTSLLSAARLCKADLTTGMVGEFPELQGIMGGIYARAEGLDEAVAGCIAEHYLPAATDGPEPSTREGCLLALADKADLLMGCLGVGLVPKGSADPYGLRRAAQGCCRLLRAEPLSAASISLDGLLRSASLGYQQQGLLQLPLEDVVAQGLEFMEQRLRHLIEAGGITFDTARAVTAAGFDDVRSVWRRAETLAAIRKAENRDGRADFEALATSAKRIRNILTQAAGKGIGTGGSVDRSLMPDREEVALHDALIETAHEVASRMRAGDWEHVWSSIAAMRPHVDRFFDKVLVMAEDEALRRNRLALLGELSDLLSRAADFSEIVVAGDIAGEKR